MITPREKDVLHELAKQYVEIMSLPINDERKQRCKNINDCIKDRPPVWIDEIPWHEMDIDGQLILHCQDDFARHMEWFFRTNLYRWKYIQADMVLPKFYPIYKSYSSRSIGVEINETIKKTDDKNNIVSHQYEDQLDTEEKLEKLKIPTITVFPEKDEENMQKAHDILGDILPAKLCGTNFGFCPWDDIAMLRGVENILFDLIDRPEFMHKTMQKFTEIGISRMEQLEKLGLLDSAPLSLHCTPPFVSDLESTSDKTVGAKLSNVWYRGMAQMFSTVSPSMFEEFEIDYIKPLAERCGLTYYGCCEPLDNFIPVLKKINNLRKIGVSPWANEEKCAQQIGSNYVYARKPNPAMVSGAIDKDAVKNEIKKTLEICREYNCAAEFVLKDISTVGHNPQNLIDWNDTVQRTIDEFYR